MRAGMHSIAAAPRVSQRTRSMRWPPRGGRCVECANREMRGVARTECISERISEQFSRERCLEMRSAMHSVGAAPRISQFTRSMRQPPC
eukprot:4086606-Lingulodinium_polyedra.AAC.1